MTPGEQTRDYYRKQGAQAERERIIKLLETFVNERQANGQTITSGHLEAIALIKGEK